MAETRASASPARTAGDTGGIRAAWDAVRRAFAEFLALPSLIIVGFLALSIATFALDRSELLWVEAARQRLSVILSDSATTAALLGTVAGSLITVTSITISLLLVAVQQAAGTMTAQVYDQFLRRRHNQFHFGFFVGLSLFALVTLASVGDSFNPIIGATLVLLLTVLALSLLIVLLYATIDQMRPIEIIERIHDQTLVARERQRALLKDTSGCGRRAGPATVSVHAVRHGFVTAIDVARLRAAVSAARDECEVTLSVAIGAFVAWGGLLAEVRAASREDARILADATLAAVHLERQRDIAVDPAYGIAQLETIAWTSISTAKSDPAPGILTVYALRDILARWSRDDPDGDERDSNSAVVYADTTPVRLMDAFETLAVATSESMQHQSLVAILSTFTLLFDRMPPGLARRIEDLVLRILPAIGDHVLTAELEHALRELRDTLAASSRTETAARLQVALLEFAGTVGTFGSRSTRGRGREVPEAAGGFMRGVR